MEVTNLCCVQNQRRKHATEIVGLLWLGGTGNFCVSPPRQWKRIDSYYSTCTYRSHRQRMRQAYIDESKGNPRGGIASNMAKTTCLCTSGDSQEKHSNFLSAGWPFFCYSVSFVHMRTNHKHAATCSLQSMCRTDPAPCSANKHVRLEGIILTACSSFLGTVTVVRCCSL